MSVDVIGVMAARLHEVIVELYPMLTVTLEQHMDQPGQPWTILIINPDKAIRKASGVDRALVHLGPDYVLISGRYGERNSAVEYTARDFEVAVAIRIHAAVGAILTPFFPFDWAAGLDESPPVSQ